MVFAKFMASDAGRAIRIGAGLVFMIAALFGLQGTGAVILAAVGAIVFAAGGFNFCLIAPLIGAPFRGGDALAHQANARS
jgi:Protein of unknown function (DUF2892)